MQVIAHKIILKIIILWRWSILASIRGRRILSFL
jgi:hypothetical protein